MVEAEDASVGLVIGPEVEEGQTVGVLVEAQEKVPWSWGLPDALGAEVRVLDRSTPGVVPGSAVAREAYNEDIEAE